MTAWLEERGEWVIHSSYPTKAEAVEARIAIQTHATRLDEMGGGRWAVLIECLHVPNDRGTACAHCGIPAEMVPPDELAAAMMAAHDALILERAGQLTAFGDGR